MRLSLEEGKSMIEKDSHATGQLQSQPTRRLSKKNAPPSAPDIDLPLEESIDDLSVAEKVERAKATTEPKHRTEQPKR